MRWFTILCVAFLGCGGADTLSVSAKDDSSGSFVFAGGDFQLRVNAVSDGCLDGSLDLLFMPSGTEEPYALSHRTWIPAVTELPQSYEIQLKEPFSNMTITMESNGQNSMKIAGADQGQVELGLPGGQCAAQMSFSALVTLISATSLHMNTQVVLSEFSSKAELCPLLATDPCTVELEMYGEL